MTIRSHRWTDLSRREIRLARDAGALPVIPVGSIEQHADYLPVDTDSFSSYATSLAAAEKCDSPHVLVLPPPAYGFAPHHQSFAGTVSFKLATFLAVVTDIVTSLHWQGFKRILIVNGHGGNCAPMASLVGELGTVHGIEVATVDYWSPGKEAWVKRLKGQYKNVGHACEFETSFQLALRDKAASDHIAAQIKNLPPRLEAPYLRGSNHDPLKESGAVFPPIFGHGDVGYVGDPAHSSVETGKAIFADLVDGLAKFYGEFARVGLKAGTDKPE